jgi:hypothetical protein
MATGHTTYSTVHADSAQSLIHRLEGKPIEIPRVMLQSLDIVTIQVNAMLGDQRVRRCKQIVEIVDIDPVTKEILTNEVFRWDPVEDAFYYSGKSYVLERIRNQYEMSKEEMMAELRRRVEILEWMKNNNIRMFKDVARVVATYAEAPGEFMEKIRRSPADVLKNQPQQMLDAALQVTLVKQEELQLEEKKSAVLKKKEEQPPVASSKKKKKIGLRRRDADNTYEVSKG